MVETTSEYEDIEVEKFISVCVQLSECAGDIIREVVDQGKVNFQVKIDGPVTEADLRIQRTIVHNLKTYFPSLNVRGEESPDMYLKYEPAMQPTDFYDAKYGKLLQENHQKRNDFIQERRVQNYYSSTLKTFEEEPFQKFSTKNAVVWIDPLDGTSDFIKGRLSAVTCLIGLAIDGVSKIGIVHSPYFDINGDGSAFQSRTYFATEEHGAYLLPYTDRKNKDALMARIPQYIDPSDTKQAFTSKDNVVLVYSQCHHSDYLKSCLPAMQPSIIKRTGGAGNKSLWVANGKVDCYLAYSLCKWDLCAPSVITNALGGYHTDLFRNEISYADDGNDYIDGTIMGRTYNIFQEIAKRMKKVASY